MRSGFLGNGIGPVAMGGASAAAGNGLLNGLVAYWPLNEAGGANNALDLHTGALHLTQQSSPGADTGKVYATARTFDGSADYFSRAYSVEDALNFGAGDFTIAAWVHLQTTANNVAILDKRGASPGSGGNGYRGYLLAKISENFRFDCYQDDEGNNRAFVDAPAIYDAWALVVAWRTAENLYLSINNGAPASAAMNAAWNIDNGAAATFGYKSTTRTTSVTYFPGRIGPVAMWKSASGGGVLSEAQRAALWNGGAGLAYADFTA